MTGEPTHIIAEPGYEKKVMRGPADKLKKVLEIAEFDEAISGWKPDAIIYEGNGMARIIFKRKIQ